LDGTFPSEPAEAGDDLDDPTAVPGSDATAALVDSPPTAEQQAVLEGLVPLVQERMQTLAEVQRYAPAFLADEVELDPASVEKVFRKAGAPEAIAAAREVLADLGPGTTEGMAQAVRGLRGQHADG